MISPDEDGGIYFRAGFSRLWGPSGLFSNSVTLSTRACDAVLSKPRTDVTDLVHSLLLIRIPQSLDYFSPSLCIPKTLKNPSKTPGKHRFEPFLADLGPFGG